MINNFQELGKEKEEDAFTVQDEWKGIGNGDKASTRDEKPEFDLFGTALNEL